MGNASEEPMLPNSPSDVLIQQIDALELPELISFLSYVWQPIKSLRTSLEAEIEANAAGEFLEIENHGAYALMGKYLPDTNDPGADPGITSPYLVRREQQFNGRAPLHRAYLGKESITRRRSAARLADELSTRTSPSVLAMAVTISTNLRWRNNLWQNH